MSSHAQAIYKIYKNIDKTVSDGNNLLTLIRFVEQSFKLIHSFIVLLLMYCYEHNFQMDSKQISGSIVRKLAWFDSLNSQNQFIESQNS